MRHITKAISLLILTIPLLLSSLAGCADEIGSSSNAEIVADGAYDASPLPVPSASNEVYLDKVTKRSLTHLIFFHLSSSEKIVETHLLRREAGARYDEDAILKHQERVRDEAALLSRVVSIKENDSKALNSAYDELLGILGVAEDPDAWDKVESAMTER